ncbi:MAG: hypothetical protein V1793_01945 [Pseudomonadota bacterium]
METQLGGRSLVMDMGNLNAAFSCIATLHYDLSKGALIIKPYLLQKPDGNRTDDKAATLLSLLSLANGEEYPVEMNKLQPFISQICGVQLSIGLIITDFHTKKDMVYIKIKPEIKKINSTI